MKFVVLSLSLAALLGVRLAYSQSVGRCHSEVLLYAQPEMVNSADLEKYAVEVDDNLQAYHLRNGILWPATRSKPDLEKPDGFGSGGDAALFSGYYLATAAFRYSVTRNSRDLDKVMDSLRGIYILSHISGVPGVVARFAFPVSEKSLWDFPERFATPVNEEHFYQSSENITDAFDPLKNYPAMYFYTETSRDQLTGIVYGLAAVWSKVQATQGTHNEDLRKIELVRRVAKQTSMDIYHQAASHGFVIEDQNGKRGGNASKLRDTSKVMLQALWAATSDEKGADEAYSKALSQMLLIDSNFVMDTINRFGNVLNYFVWPLRFARVHALYLLDGDTGRRAKVSEYMRKHLFPFVKNHGSAMFGTIRNAVDQEHPEKVNETIWSLKSASLLPLRSCSSPLYGSSGAKTPAWKKRVFGNVSGDVIAPHLRSPDHDFLWQRDPFFLGGEDHEGLTEHSGLDFLLPYWTARMAGIL